MIYRIIIIIVLMSGYAVSQSDPGNFPAKGPYFPVDDRIIEDRWQIERFVVPLEKHAQNPLITKDYTWEGTGPYMQGSAVYDKQDNLYKMWYLVWDNYAYYNNLRFSYNVCYAESKDGIAWRKPFLGIFNNKGDRNNNCIKLGRNKTQGIDVTFHPKPKTANDKFVAIHNDSGGVFVSTSADGKTFHCNFKKAAVPYHSDTHNNFVYDEVRDRWLMYVRPKAYAGSGLKGVGRRRVAVKESKDMENWTDEYTVLVPDEADPDYFYGMTVFRVGDLFFGALQLYETVHHHIDCELVWSADGYSWERLPKEANKIFLHRGLKGNWDAGMVFLSDRPVRVGDQMWFYYGGNNTPHDTIGTPGVGMGITRMNRLIGVRSIPGEESRLLTRPILVDGNLMINAKAEGEIRVQISDERDNILDGWSAKDCTPFSGDKLAAEIKWGEKRLTDLKGSNVRLRFLLNDAELYCFDIK